MVSDRDSAVRGQPATPANCSCSGIGRDFQEIRGQHTRRCCAPRPSPPQTDPAHTGISQVFQAALRWQQCASPAVPFVLSA